MDQSNTPVPGLGARLRAARKARGLTQEALAGPEFTKSKSCPVGKTAKSNRVPPVVV
jgi:hypothetical protein